MNKELEKVMKDSQKGLTNAIKKGGHFYFIVNSKGDKAAIVVTDKGRDEDGQKAFRRGRTLLKVFKSEYGKGVYSLGEIGKPDSVLVFSIKKGSAKPALMKKAFKFSSVLHEGVGKHAKTLKAAKIMMFEAETSAPETLEAFSAEQRTEFEAFENNPEMIELLAGLSEAERLEVFAAQKDFEKQHVLMKTTEEEETKLEERQAESERLLVEIDKKQKEFEELTKKKGFFERKGNYEKRLEKVSAVEESLNELRLQLAQNNPVGSNLFSQGDVLAEADQRAFDAALRSGLQLLRQRAKKIEGKVKEKRVAFENEFNGSEDNRTDERRASFKRKAKEFKAQIRPEMESIEEQVRGYGG